MEQFVTRPVLSTDTEFEVCYGLMQATFPADELVPRAEYEALLQTPHKLSHPHWFALLARYAQSTSRLVGMIAGSYMRLNQEESAGATHVSHLQSNGIGMIEYLAIAPHDQHQGHGPALLSDFERLMGEYAAQRGETLNWMVGEVDNALLPFKFQLGYGLPASLVYVQPPIEFDAEGVPCFAAVPKHLVLKPMAGQAMQLDALELTAIIQTIYRWRYLPLLGDESAKTRAAAYLAQHITPHVLAHIGEGTLLLSSG